MLYHRLIRPLLFRAWKDPESAHEAALEAMQRAAESPALLGLISAMLQVRHPNLERRIGNLVVPNPVGLAAGFDKKGEVVPAVQAMGFGFVTTGTFTPMPQEGWPRPRIWRNPLREELYNRMGFPGDGAEAGADALLAMRRRGDVRIPVGASIGMQKGTNPEDAHQDYEACIDALTGLVDYFEVNVSSPNTERLRLLQGANPLEKLLRECRMVLRETASSRGLPSPGLWVKISPDLENTEVRDVVQIAIEQGVDAMVATNTVKSPVPGQPDKNCGKSGSSIFPRALKKVEMAADAANGCLPIIAVGGLNSVRRLLEMERAGASAFQLYTGLIYKGPRIARTLNRGLLHHR